VAPPFIRQDLRPQLWINPRAPARADAQHPLPQRGARIFSKPADQCIDAFESKLTGQLLEPGLLIGDRLPQEGTKFFRGDPDVRGATRLRFPSCGAAAEDRRAKP